MSKKVSTISYSFAHVVIQQIYRMQVYLVPLLCHCLQCMNCCKFGYVSMNFSQAQLTLGLKRVEASLIKSSLEGTIRAHKESLKKAKSVEKQIQVTETY